MDDQKGKPRSEDVYNEKIERCVKNLVINTGLCTVGGGVVSALWRVRSPLVFGFAFGAGLAVSNCNYEFSNKKEVTKYPEYASFKQSGDDKPFHWYDYFRKNQSPDSLAIKKESEPKPPSPKTYLGQQYDSNQLQQYDPNSFQQYDPNSFQQYDPNPSHHIKSNLGSDSWAPEQKQVWAPGQKQVWAPEQKQVSPKKTYVRDEYGRPVPNNHW